MTDNYDRFDELAEEFAVRHRRGERPSVQEYIDRLPEMADEIREMFPALAEVEEVEGDARGHALEPPPPATPRIRELGDFRIVREIGRGGMGVVYEAEQVSLGRHVALKVLPNHSLKDVKQKRRFEREARAAAKLHHTNIVPVFGVGEHDGLPYYVMQHIQGLGLDAVIDELNHIQPGGSALQVANEVGLTRRGATAAQMAHSLMTGAFPREDSAVDLKRAAAATLVADAAEVEQERSLPNGSNVTLASGSPAADAPHSGHHSDSFSLAPSSLSLPGSGSAVTGRKSAARKQSYWQSVANIGRQVADALEYAHKQGVLHRDVKPSNLLLDIRGTVWVTDFGLAKVAGPGAENLTHTGDILGTLRYMPPEAFEGKSDARSDVYSLGLTLYELLALKPAFDEKERNKLIKQVTSGEPTPLNKVRNEIPRDLVTIVQKSIEREPARRYSTADELAADLQRFIDDEPIQARRQTHLEKYVRWARHNPGIAALGAALSTVLVIATIASLIVAGQMARSAADERLARIAAVDAQKREAAERTKAEHSQKTAENSFVEARRAEQIANNERERADHEAEVAEANLYYAQIHLALQAWRDHRGLPHMRELLDNWLPKKNSPDRRGWEWFYLNSLPYQNVRRFAGNGRYNPCNIIAWHSPSRRLAQGTSDGLIRIWDIDRERTILTLSGPVPADAWEGTKWLAWSPDGTKLAAGSHDGNVYLYETKSGRELRVTKAHESPVRTVAFASDGARLATWGQDGTTRIWDVDTGRMMTEVIGPGSAYSGAWSPDNQFLASGYSDGRVTIRGTRPGAKSVVLSAHSGSIYDLSFSPDSSKLATASDDFTAKIWDVSSQKMIRGPLRHSHRIASLSWEPDGRRLATGSVDEAVKVWNATTGHEEVTLRGSPDRITSIAWGPGDRIASACIDGSVTIWNSIHDQESRVLMGHTHEVLRVCWSPDGKRLASGGGDGEVRVWDAATRKLVQTISARAGTIRALAWHPNGRQLAMTGDSSTIIVWELAGNRQVFSVPTEHGWARSLVWSPDGNRLAAGLEETIQIVEELSSTPKAHRFRADEGTVLALAWSPKGDRLASGGKEGVVKVWGPTRGTELFRGIDAGRADILGLAWSADGKRLASATNTRLVVIWDADSGRKLRTLRGHNDFVAAVVWSPDGTRLASAGLDNSVRVWDSQTGEETVVLRGDYGFFHDVAWNPDGAQVAAASSDGQVWIWDATRGFERDTTPRALPFIERAVASGTAKGEDPRWYAESYLRAGKFSEALFAVKGDPFGLCKLALRFNQEGHPKWAKLAREQAIPLVEEQLADEPDNRAVASELADLMIQGSSARWTVLRPTDLKSSKGATLKLQADASILVSGTNVSGDIYTIAGLGDLDRIAAIRLEVLPDPSLPGGGPGRHPSGNFQLSAFRIFATSKDDAHRRAPLPLESVWASYDYKAHDADIAGTIDEKLKKVWHVWLRWGQAHEAIFWLKEASAAKGRRVEIELRHRDWRSTDSLNLGRFRLSVSSDFVAEKKNRLFTMMPADPWAKLAAAYHFADNQEAVKALLKRHPGAASFKGDIHAANRLWEPAIAEYTSLISKERPDAGLSAKLAQAYQASDRTRQAIPFLAILSAANPDDTNFTMKVAALQAWFGQEKELAETCARGLELAKNTSSAGTAERTAKICCLLPTQDKTGAASALVLARKAVELGKADSLLPWFQMALGMAEYRNGRFADADVTLSAATREGRGMLTVPDTSAFFRAMSLYQQGKKDEAKKLASEAAATMKPLPKDEQNPLSGDASHDALILWLAYKEAQAMIKFAAAPAAMSQPEGK